MFVSSIIVLFGRGRPFILHPGNVRMKEMIVGLKTTYQNASKDAKGKIVASVIKRLRASGGPGKHVRFLRSKSQTRFGPWEVATDDQVKKKVGHILRSKFELRCVPKPPPPQPSAPLPAAMPQALNFVATNLNVPGINPLGPLTPIIPLQAVHPAAAAALIQMTTPVNPILALTSHPGWVTTFAPPPSLVGIPAATLGGIPNAALGAAIQHPFLLQQQPAILLPQQQHPPPPQQLLHHPPPPQLLLHQQAMHPSPEAVQSAAAQLLSTSNGDSVNADNELDAFCEDLFDV